MCSVKRPGLSYRMASMLKTLKHRYSRINDDHEDPGTSSLEPCNSDVIMLRYRTAASALLSAALIGALGFWMGQHAFQSQIIPSSVWPTEKTAMFHSGHILRPFNYNQTFASAPSAETNMAWDSLFPSE